VADSVPDSKRPSGKTWKTHGAGRRPRTRGNSDPGPSKYGGRKRMGRIRLVMLQVARLLDSALSEDAGELGASRGNVVSL